MLDLFDNDDVKWMKVICNSQASYYNIVFFQQLLDLIQGVKETGHSQKDRKLIFMTNYRSIMQVKVLQNAPTLDLH